jgi:hypothetical protein
MSDFNDPSAKPSEDPRVPFDEQRKRQLEDKLRRAGAEGAGRSISLMNEQAQTASSRKSARGMIENEIHFLMYRADKLTKLLGALPAVLPPEADEALWDLLIRSKR